VLVSAVAFDLVQEAVDTTDHDWVAFVGIAAGCAVFAVGDWVIGRMGGGSRKRASGAPSEDDGDALGIVLGTVLDGIPESLVIGLTIAQGGGIGTAYLIAVFISNLPEAISSTSGLRESGRTVRWVLGLWVGIALVSGVASLLGYALFDGASDAAVALVLTFAAGAILTMLADTMFPEAYENARRSAAVGVATTLGFAVAFAIHTVS
jgi:ZIP family zinc transporter